MEPINKKQPLRPPNVGVKGKKVKQSSMKPTIPSKIVNPPQASINKGLDDLALKGFRIGKEISDEFVTLGFEVAQCAGKEICLNKIPENKDRTVIELNPEEWVFSEADMVTSWNTQDDGLTLTQNSLAYVNKKNEGIKTPDLLKYYNSFIGAYVFKNHVQDENLAKGVVLDATLRSIVIGTIDRNGEQVPERIFYVRGLQAFNKKDDALLAEAVRKGDIKYCSMGNAYFNKQCSKCGATGLKTDEGDTRCVHLKLSLGQYYEAQNGETSKIVEWWSDTDNNGNENFIEFIEISALTIDPAFNGAIVRHNMDVIKVNRPIRVEIDSIYLKKPAFQRYLKRGDIKVVKPETEGTTVSEKPKVVTLEQPQQTKPKNTLGV